MRFSFVLAAALFASPVVAEPAAPAIGPDEAIAILKDGNARFAAGDSTFPHLDQDRRCATVEGGQHPIASILACADSRVPAELLFDAGVGDLLVVRVAGNVADTDEIGTLEYAAGQLEIPLIVVMGHTKCDAVTGVVQGAKVGGNVARLFGNIAPAVAEARERYAGVPEAKLVQQAIRANVRQAMKDVLTHSPEIAARVAAGHVRVVGAVYDLHNGTIEWLGDHPQQAALLKTGPADAAAREASVELVSPVATRETEPSNAANADREEATTTTPASARKAAHAEPAAAPDDEHAPAAAHAPKAAESPVEPARHAPSHGESSHATPAAKAAAKPSDKHEATHGASPHGDAEGTQPAPGDAAHDAAAAPKSLIERQGLLLPGAFMAAGSVLSGTLVFLMKGRGATAVAATQDATASAGH